MIKLCACGCETPITSKRKLTEYIPGHNDTSKLPLLTKICACGCGKEFQTNKKHRKFFVGHNRRKQKEPDIWIDCACGCGQKLIKFSRWGIERKYINHHSRRFKTHEDYLRSLCDRRKEIKEENQNLDFPKEIIKECKECGLMKPHSWNSTFYLGSKKPEYKAKCRECTNEYHKANQKKNRPRVTQLVKKRRNKRKDDCIAYLGGKCNSCGYIGPRRAMTFHHKDPKIKEQDIAKILDHSWDKLKNELDKCELLCFRCHMEIEDHKDREKTNVS